MSELDVSIDPQALDIEIMGQPLLMQQATEAQANAQEKVDILKLKLEVKEAELRKDVAVNYKDHGYTKAPTVKDVDALIILNDDYVTLRKRRIAAEKEFNLLKGAVSTLDHRKRAIECAVTLHGQSYFAGPSVPREGITKVVIEEQATKRVRNRRRTKDA